MISVQYVYVKTEIKKRQYYMFRTNYYFTYNIKLCTKKLIYFIFYLQSKKLGHIKWTSWPKCLQYVFEIHLLIAIFIILATGDKSPPSIVLDIRYYSCKRTQRTA